jgi:lysophospholipase L1-like esterase
VRNGRGDGANGQRGWGDLIGKYFDPAKINVVNWAVGGRSSRTFIAIGIGSYPQAGDFVIIQFGHNDDGLSMMTFVLVAQFAVPETKLRRSIIC